jgi:rSAM/selenodomain-associated transferase 2
VIGGDCPTVSASDLRLLLSAAAEQGASIIPAADGGFCALALRPDASARVRGLFRGIEWSTERVCTETVSALRRLGTDVAELGTRCDIDRPEDLPEWETVRHSWLERPESLTVVVPVLNEAPHLPAIVSALHAEGVDLIVADGGSTDGSARIAEEAGAVVLGGPAGRGRQLNAGARAARSDALLFLHADTRLPDGFSRLVLDALQDPTVALGAFTFATDSVSPAMRLIEAGTRLRTRLLALPYGDQALFCRRAMFEALGGFPEMPVMEDYELVRRARRVGRIALLHEPAVTSERRWREHGIWRWTALNLATVARYHLGTPAEELAAWRRGYSKR